MRCWARPALLSPQRPPCGEIHCNAGPSRLTLNGLGARVYALSSGKLRTREIVDQVARELDGTAPPMPTLTQDVVQFVRHLDQNYAVFLKDF